MSDVQITLVLPEELVNAAREEGLLTDERIAAWLESELDRRRALTALRRDVMKLRALKPELSQSEIDAEIEASSKEAGT